MRENIQSLPMSEVAVFAENLAKNLFMFYSDIDNQVKDKVAKSLYQQMDATASLLNGLIHLKIGWKYIL